MNLTDERLKDVILEGKRHAYYMETVKEADHLSFHIDGFEYPWYDEKISRYDRGSLKNIDFLEFQGNIWFNILIGEYRPEESQDSKAYAYRMKNYKAITKSTVSQVIGQFQKITRSSDWMIRFNNEKPSGISESLEDFFLNYPRWGKFINFLQMVLVQKVCADPNAVIAVFPYEQQDDNSILPRPEVRFYGSRYVLDYSDKNYAICFDADTKEYCVYTRQYFRKYVPVKDGIKIIYSFDYPRQLNTFNCTKTKGVYKNSNSDNVLYDSFVSSMLPYLDKAVRESSDLDASTVRAMFPQAWQWAGLMCKHCNGTGRYRTPGLSQGQPVVCPECGGLGSIAHSPSQVITVKPQGLPNDQQLPIPPKGFIEPSTAIIELQKQSIEDHKYSALAAINFQNLHRVPLNESGKAKEVDREDQHNIVQKVAENIVDNAIFISKATNELRYMVVKDSAGLSDDSIDQMLPKIPVPEDFSIVTAEGYLEELEKAKLSGVSVSTRRELELQYIRKRWRNNEEEAKRCEAYILLNPGYGMDAAQILMSDFDPVQKSIALNIMYFVDKAIEEHDDFLDMDMEKQEEILEGYANERVIAPADEIDDVENSNEGGG